MKEIKQKPAGGKPKTADAARVPKAVVKAAWLQAREAARAGEKQVVGGKDGAYSGAADTGEKGADKLVSTGERVTELAYRGGRKLAERSAGRFSSDTRPASRVCGGLEASIVLVCAIVSPAPWRCAASPPVCAALARSRRCPAERSASFRPPR